MTKLTRPDDTTNNPNGGNRCGYLVTAPRFLDVRHPHPLIAALQDAARLLYQRRADGLLWLGRRRTRHRERGERHDRLPRGERVEAIALVVQDMAAHLDLATLRIVDYSDDQGVSLSRYAADCALSVDRVKGAIADLKSCGYIGGRQKREIRNGRYRGCKATRWILRPLLEVLGRLAGRNFVRWIFKLRGRGVRPTSPPVQSAQASAQWRSLVSDLSARQQV